jgi:diacylglycerol O-acyltransferase
VGLASPVDRLAAIRGQMDEYKKAMSAVDAASIIEMGNYVAPTLLALGVRAAMQAGQFWVQAVTTNVPGPRFPLYVLGKKMVSAYAYVPIAGGTRCSIGIFSYQNTMTFGLNADFDGYPDIDTLSGGIRRGLDELLTLAKQHSAKAAEQPKSAAEAASPTSAPAKRTAAKAAPAKPAAPKKKTAAAAQQ